MMSSIRGNAGQVRPAALSVIAAVGLVGFLAFLFFFRPRNLPEAEQIDHPAPPAQTRVVRAGPAEERTEAAACRANLVSLRETILKKKIKTSLPPTLQALNEVPMTEKTCPLNRQYYAYNPQTGQIYCATAGHREF